MPSVLGKGYDHYTADIPQAFLDALDKPSRAIDCRVEVIHSKAPPYQDYERFLGFLMAILGPSEDTVPEAMKAVPDDKREATEEAAMESSTVLQPECNNIGDAAKEQVTISRKRSSESMQAEVEQREPKRFKSEQNGVESEQVPTESSTVLQPKCDNICDAAEEQVTVSRKRSFESMEAEVEQRESKRLKSEQYEVESEQAPTESSTVLQPNYDNIGDAAEEQVTVSRKRSFESMEAEVEQRESKRLKSEQYEVESEQAPTESSTVLQPNYDNIGDAAEEQVTVSRKRSFESMEAEVEQRESKRLKSDRAVVDLRRNRRSQVRCCNQYATILVL